MIKILKDSYGAHNIQQAIEAVMEETNLTDDNLANDNLRSTRQQEIPQVGLKLSNSEESFLPQATNPFCSQKELTKPEDVSCFQEIERDFSSQSQLFVKGYSRPQVLSMAYQNNYERVKSSTSENNDQGLDDSNSNSDSYLSWYVEFEKNIHNPERLLDI